MGGRSPKSVSGGKIGTTLTDLLKNANKALKQGYLGDEEEDEKEDDEAAYDEAIKQNNIDLAEDLVKDKGFEALPDGRLIGYRVSQFKDGRAVSGADSRQSAGLDAGDIIEFPGKGTFVTPYPEYALDYYAGHDINVIQKVAFKEEDVLSGNKDDREPELSIKSAEVLDSEQFADEETPTRLNKIAAIAKDQNGNVIPLSKRFPRLGDQINKNAANKAAKAARLASAPPSSPPSIPPSSPPSSPPSIPPSSPPSSPPSIPPSSGGGTGTPPPPPTTPPGGSNSGSNQPPKKFPNSDSPISEIIEGNISSPTFIENAKKQGLTPEEWRDKLAKIEENMLTLDANNELTMNDDDFNKEIGDMVIQNMRDNNAKHQQGVLKTLPNTGKVIVIGDLHEQGDNLLSILKDIQDNPETNLDKNPDVKIMFLGDIFSGSKVKPGYRDGNQDGEITNRLTTLLLAKYPDQIHSIMGNHDMGVVTGERYLNDPSFILKDYSPTDKDNIRNDPNMTQDEKNKLFAFIDDYEDKRGTLLADAQSAHPDATGTTSNKKHIIEKINNTPLATVIGDKSKGETVRLFVHSPPSGQTQGLDALKQAASLQDIINDPQNALYASMMGDISLLGDPVKLKSFLNSIGVDEIYFGHIGTKTMIDRRASTPGNDVPSLKKTDNLTNSPLGSFEGGGNYIDSQGKDSRSGYMLVDLDKGSSSSKTMADVINKHGADPAIDRINNVNSKVVSKKASQAFKDFTNKFKSFPDEDETRRKNLKIIP